MVHFVRNIDRSSRPSLTHYDDIKNLYVGSLYDIGSLLCPLLLAYSASCYTTVVVGNLTLVFIDINLVQRIIASSVAEAMRIM